jgi:hypothetical protein
MTQAKRKVGLRFPLVPTWERELLGIGGAWAACRVSLLPGSPDDDGRCLLRLGGTAASGAKEEERF